MTENQPTTEPTTTEPTEPATPTTPTTDPTTTDPATLVTEPDQPGSSEAAKRRVQLREVEAERDGLKATVAALQRADGLRYCVDLLQDPEDLWRDGLALADILGEDGVVDRGLVAAAVADLGERHAHWLAPRRGDTRRHPAPLRSNVIQPGEQRDASWTDVLRGK